MVLNSGRHLSSCPKNRWFSPSSWKFWMYVLDLPPLHLVGLLKAWWKSIHILFLLIIERNIFFLQVEMAVWHGCFLWPQGILENSLFCGVADSDCPLFWYEGNVAPKFSGSSCLVMFCLLVCTADSIRAMTKYGKEMESQTLDSQLDQRFKECRGQRNFYITGFSLFLML